MALIEIEELTKIYSGGKTTVEALRGVDLSVQAGEIFGVIGLSGAGKSTLIRCLNRLETPTGGRVIIDGRDITALAEGELRLARRDMGMIFQHFNLLSSRTVFGNVAFPLEIAGKPVSQIAPRVNELLELVGLADKAGAYPSQLSGGQKQRVGIARALANNPKVLLCDEATSALDPQTTQSILTLLQDVKDRLGLTIVLITHDMKVITEICDRVAVMEDGRIVEMGNVIDVFIHPRHPTSRKFVNVLINQSNSTDVIGYRPEGTLIRVLFIGEKALDPVISSMIKQFGITVNFLQGRLDHIKGAPYGTLLMDLAGPEDERHRALDFLKSLKLNVEVYDHGFFPDAADA